MPILHSRGDCMSRIHGPLYRIHGPLYPPEIQAKREKRSKDDERREQDTGCDEQ